VELQEGPLEQFTHDMEPFLRKQGMPVRLNRGVVELVADYTVCTEGEPVSPEASRILRLLHVRMAAFHLHLLCRWSPGEFETYETQTKIQVDNPSNGS
jgi:mRNA turnover protein 4